MRLFFTFSLLLLAPQNTSKVNAHWLVVWNVGQGSFLSLVGAQECLHIDAGGSIFPQKLVQKLCNDKNNRMYFTHYDRDHTSFVRKLNRILARFCLAPKTRPDNKFKELPTCQDKSQRSLTILNHPDFKKRNDGYMIIVEKQILITGDMPKSLEKKQLRYNSLNHIRTYIVGHHGSNTSTSKELLRHISNTHLAIVSAQKQIYGHPHQAVALRLRKNKIPLLRTEVFGHILLEMP